MRRKEIMSRISELVNYYGPMIAWQGEFSAYDEYDGLRYGDFADSWKYPVMEGHETGFTDTTLRKNGKEGWLYTYDGIYIKDAFDIKQEIPFAGLEDAVVDKARLSDHLSTVSVLYDDGNEINIDNISANKEPLIEFLEGIATLLNDSAKQNSTAEKTRRVDYLKEKLTNVLPDRYFITFSTDYDRDAGTWTDSFGKRLDIYLSRYLSQLVDDDDEERDNDDDYDDYEVDDDDDEKSAAYEEYADIYRKHLEKMYRSFNGSNMLAIIERPETVSRKNEGVDSRGIILTDEDLVKYDIANDGYCDSSIEYIPYTDIKDVKLSENKNDDFFMTFASIFSKVSEPGVGKSVIIEKENGRDLNTGICMDDDHAATIRDMIMWLKENKEDNMRLEPQSQDN